MRRQLEVPPPLNLTGVHIQIDKHYICGAKFCQYDILVFKEVGILSSF